MNWENDTFLRWLRYVLNPESKIASVQDWQEVYDFATRQAIIGICDPTRYDDVRMPQELLLTWIGDLQTIRAQNQLLNRRAVEVYSLLNEAGFRCCILKGQGNALMYPYPGLRSPGDVDVWVDVDEKTLYEFVRGRFPDAKECVKHIKFPIFTDVDVDVHHTPLRLFHYKHRRAFQQWVTDQKEEQFSHFVRLPETESDIAVPTARFNAVYQLGHMLIHLFDEGVGLRQVVDYYYVMKNLEASQEEHKELVSTIRDLGMMKFARAVMWIESEVLGLPMAQCVVELDERRGKRLLDDILEGGNFGFYSQRYNGKKGFYYRGLVKACRMAGLMDMAPREVIARMVSKVGTAVRHVNDNAKKYTN